MIPEGYMEDAQGNLVPLDNVKPEHLEEDALVKTLVGHAVEINKEIASFKARSMGDVEALRQLVFEKHGATLGGKKGNITLRSYDGRLQVQVAVSETLAFGPELEAAKSLIDECVLRWSTDANDNLKALVDHAFQVNKKGRIDTHRVLGLRKLKIDDPEWYRAMEAISEALRVTGSRSYIRFYRRDPKTEIVTPIPLDLAKV